MSRFAFWCVKAIGIWIALFEAINILTVRDDPYGLQDSLCTLTLYFVRRLPNSSIRSTLDTGGWLDLARQGLSP